MRKSEPRINSTLITHANKVYKLIIGTIVTHKSTSFLKIQL